MTKAEIEKRIEELEKERFYIYMADFLTMDERNRVNEIGRELKELREELKKL